MKVSFKFLNHWEYSIFENYLQKDFKPVSAFMAGTVLITAFVAMITFLIIPNDNRSLITAAAIIFGIALLIVASKAFRNFYAFPSIGTKIGYAAYILALFVFCACLFTWSSIGIVILFIFWTIVKGMATNKKSSFSSGSSNDSSDGAYRCSTCQYYPGHARYCNQGGRSVNDYNTVNCIYYRF